MINSSFGRIGPFVSSLLVSAAALGCGQAMAATVGPLRSVSPALSPFAGCTADAVGTQSGTVYPNTEIEPFVDVRPNNPANMIAGWQQDRWSNGGARGLAAGYSVDAGVTWNTSVPPGVSKCTGGPYDRASDPWVSITAGGTAYFMSLAFNQDLPDGRFGPNAMLVSRSFDGGATWTNPITLRADGAGRALNDKNSLTADPVDGSYAYAVWDRLVDYSLPGNLRAGGARGARLRAEFLRSRVAGGTDNAPAAGVALFFEGPTYFTRTTDGGNTWEVARKIYDPGRNRQTINNIVEVGTSGRIHLFFTDIDNIGRAFVSTLLSTDYGKTFNKAPRRVAEIRSSATYAITPDTQQSIRDAGILFDSAIDRSTGRLYAVWQDARFRGVEEVAFSQSLDGGKSWSAPIRVNATPANAAAPLRQQAFIPQVAVSGGKVVVTYYDFRNDGPVGELADAWVVTCAAECASAASWGGEARLTASSFDFANAPVARGLFLGDYVGLAATPAIAVPLFGVTSGVGDSADLVTRYVIPD